MAEGHEFRMLVDCEGGCDDVYDVAVYVYVQL